MTKMPEGIYIQINPPEIDLLTKLIEAYDNLGIVTTIDGKKGILAIRGTKETYPELLGILKNLPIKVKFINRLTV
ncbi:MAG TPA: DUF4911 domain-containing protein [Syntrophomonadaceae bacterium]|nr:DUF4911 domain-containing protein [Syntrophomonadaceae bacterium]